MTTEHSAQDRRHRRRLVALLCAGLFVATVLLYAQTFAFGFIGYDDPLYVDHPRVQNGLTLANARWAFTPGPGRASNYHPVTWLSHMLDLSLAGRRPGFHHAHNVVLHALAAVALLVALHRMTGDVWRPAVVAALFAWHPLHVQSVAWIAERKDVLSGLFFSLTLLAYAAYARTPTTGRYAVVLTLAALAMLAKPMLVTLPFVLLLLDAWPLRRVATGTSRSRLVLEKLPLLALAVAVSVLTVLAQGQGGAIRTTENVPLAVRLANVPVSYVRYLLKTLWPIDLAVFYPYRVWPAAVVAASTLVLLIITAMAAWPWRRRPYLIVGWLIFLGMLVPVIGLVQVGEQSIADRYTHLPLIGLFVVVCYVVPPRKSVGVVAAIALLACAAVTVYQVRFWRDDLTLFRRALETTDGNYLAHGYVGKALAPVHPADAMVHYDRALELKPRYFEVHYNRANLLLAAGRLDDAIAGYRRAVEINPDFPEAWQNLAAAYARKGDFETAREYLKRAANARASRESRGG